jgi:hypothetical protein
MEEEVINPFIGDELEIMCHRAVLNMRKVNLEREIREYSALFKYARPEMESFKKLLTLVDDMVVDLNDVNEKLKEAI